MDWTMGELGHFSIIVRKNAYVTVDWGDGSPLQTIIGTGERQDPCRYGSLKWSSPRRRREPYSIITTGSLICGR